MQHFPCVTAQRERERLLFCPDKKVFIPGATNSKITKGWWSLDSADMLTFKRLLSLLNILSATTKRSQMMVLSETIVVTALMIDFR